MNDQIKIILSYHKKDILFKDDVLTPIHAGRSIALREKSGDDEDIQWLLANMPGDDTGDNISDKNKIYNEMTTVYWAWKNYDKIGDPDYIGFMHYRRHFIFKEMDQPVYECLDSTENYFDLINYSEDKIVEIMQTCDFVCSAPYYRKTVYDHYKKNHDVADLDCVMTIIEEQHPEYVESMHTYLDGNDAYFCNMFIFDKKTFFEYAEWLFSITFELEKRRDMSGKRLFLSEWLTGIFITHLIQEGKKGRFFPTMIVEGEHTIPLVFAADNNYAFPMFAAIVSAFETAKENTVYDVHLLLSGDFSKENYIHLDELREKYSRHFITAHNMNDQYEGVEMQIKHISHSTYYRMNLPSILQDVNKCIYLDTDVIIKEDLSELFRINIDDKYIAGVRAAGYNWPESKVRDRLESLNIPSLDQYVNAGVLLVNLANMRKDNLQETLNKLVDENFESQDQDILNKVCYDKIRVLPLRFNTMIKYGFMDRNSYMRDKSLQISFSMHEWEDACKHPVIIHYADRVKPWDDVRVDFAKDWWIYASKLPFFTEVFDKYKDAIFDMTKMDAPLIHELIENHEKIASEEAREDEGNKIKNTPTFKIGEIIVFIPRKIYRGIACVKEHGLPYTAKLFVSKISNLLKKKATPKVSVIVPVYNAAEFLPECIDSILSQSLNDIEVICVDDGSRDNSLKILREYEKSDPRVKVISQENQGAGVARNTGMKQAKGEYLSFLDSDDFFEPQMLEKAYDKACSTEADICVFRADRFDQKTKEYIDCSFSFKSQYFPDHEPFSPREDDVRDNIFRMFNGWAWDKLFKGNFVREHNLQFQDLRTTNDMFFVFVGLAVADKIATIDEIFAHQRVEVTTSLSRTREKSWNCFYIALTAMKQELENVGYYEIYEKAFVNWALDFSLWNLNTMKGDSYKKTYDLLRSEGFNALGITRHGRGYYYNQGQYEQYMKIMQTPFDEYVSGN